MDIVVDNKYQGLRCKICDGNTSILGVKDFNRSCEEEKGRQIFAPIGHALYYHKCGSCGFIFTTDLDNWSIDDYIKNIYNDEYIKIDPDYSGKRPKDCVAWFSPLLGGDKSITLLDYGAGNDLFSKELNAQGYDAVGWDPMWQTAPAFEKDTTFDVVTAFEVLEHTPSPWETIKEIISFVKPETGQIVVSTLVNDIIGSAGSEYWYLSPRNGHVCMHSQKSLSIMFDKVGMEVQSFSPSQHIASWKD
jgi:2-polyprenyl-6-hydroxyphenyl methylase/3-demethylubiquinone-9 3-methyltransferase